MSIATWPTAALLLDLSGDACSAEGLPAIMQVEQNAKKLWKDQKLNAMHLLCAKRAA
jgi:hypothetical protein